jgi:fimbrial chaperone protein
MVLPLWMSIASPALADLMLYPTRVVFDKADRAAQVELVNQGTAPATYRIQLVNRRMNERGEFEVAATAEPGERFADDMLRFSPRQVTIAPGGSQTVRVLVRKPAELAPGEYRSHLQFDRVQLPGEPTGSSDAAAASGSVGVTISTLVGASIPLIVRHGDTEFKSEVEGMKLIAGGGKEPPALNFHIVRSGNRSVYGDLQVSYQPADGKPVEVALVRGVAVYVPNDRRLFRVPLTLAEGVAMRGGSLNLSFRDPVAAGGRILAQASIAVP